MTNRPLPNHGVGLRVGGLSMDGEIEKVKIWPLVKGQVVSLSVSLALSKEEMWEKGAGGQGGIRRHGPCVFLVALGPCSFLP